MATQDSIDKIINIRFNYKELVQGWVKANEAIEDNKKILADLKKEYETGQISLSDYKKAQLELKSTTKALTDEQRQYEKEIQNNIKVEKELGGSLNQLRANLNGLIAQYGRLSAAERESASGKALADHIKAQRDAVKEAEAAIGDYRSNVGNYENAIQNTLPVGNNFLLQLAQTAQNAGGVTNVIKGAVGAIGSLVKQMAAFIATPIGAAIAAIYASYQALSFSIREVNARIQENEELFYKNQRAMSAADAWNAAYTNSVDRMGEVMVETTSKFKTFWTQLKILAKNVMRSGFTGGFISFLGQGVEANELQKTFDELAAKQEERNTKYREGVVRIAELEAEIADARLKSNDKLKNSDAERAKYAQEAIDKTREMFRIKKDIAQLDFEIAKLSAEPTKNSVETNDKLAEMEAGLKRLNAQENSALRNLQERLNETDAKATRTAKTRAKAIKEAKYAALKAEKDYFQLVQQMRTKTKESELKSISEQNSVAKKSAEKRIGEIDILLKTAEGEQAAWLLQEKETLNKRILALDEKYQKDRISVEAKYSEEALRKELAREEARIRARLGMDAQMDALARAQVKNENYSDLKSEDNGKRLSAQRAIAQEELRIAMDKYQALLSMDEATKESLYDSDVAYQTAVLNGEMAVQDAKLETARITKEQAEYQLNITLAAMSTISGAAANLFNTLAEDNAEFAEFAKLLALFNIGVNTALAISEAIAGNAARPIKMAAAIAAVLSAIAQAYQVLNQAEKPATPKFSRGGLVTGPGTGTSDSIPARLSNGEAVMTARAVVDWGPVLSMMNVSSGGNAIPTRHLPEKSSGMRQMEQMFERVMRRLPNPVVTVRDINNGQRRVKVQDETARYAGRKR
jgi:hypothetical protein